jgi:DHA2 family multidrug resistance protein
LGRRQFAGSFIMMLMVGASLFSSTQLLPQLLQESFRYTTTLSGLGLMPGGIAMLIMMPIAARMTDLVQPKYLMAAGMLILAASMYHLTSLQGDASFGFFAWARIYQMVAVPFLFVPITTLSYADLPGELTNQASTLINVARNLGGSIGVSMATTVLARRAQFRQERLTEHLMPSSPQYREVLQQAATHFASQGVSKVDAQHQAVGWLGQLVQNQSSLLSYIDVFWIFGTIAILLVPLAFLLGPVRRRGVASASG